MRPRATIVSLVSLVLLSVACDPNERTVVSGDAAVRKLAASGQATRAAGTARMLQMVDVTFDGADRRAGGVGQGSLEVLTEGYVDIAARRGRLDVTTEATGLAGADALAGDMQIILDGESMYVKSPFFQQLAPKHEPWLRMGFGELAARGLSQLAQQDPLAFIDLLRGRYGKVEPVGKEEVRGRPATHYRATIDIARSSSKVPGDTRATIESSFGGLGIERMPVDVWLDDKGRLARLSLDVEIQRGTMGGGRMAMELDLYEFGVAFELTIPPADQVVEFSEVFGEVDG